MIEPEALPDVVYHYTSMNTLLKIVETRSIWATNIRYLNDVLERAHCLSLIRSRIPELIKRRPSLDVDLFATVLTEEETNKPFYALPFVASFSRDRDSLSQWRAYCAGGNGVCIGFRTDSLRRGFVAGTRSPARLPQFGPYIEFQPVEYVSADDSPAADVLIENVLEDARQMALEEATQAKLFEPSTMADLVWHALDQYASRTKHISFAGEREYRLLASTYDAVSEIVKYRSSRTTLVPYIPVCLPNPDAYLAAHLLPQYGKWNPYFIDSVTIGPTPNPELSADAVLGVFVGSLVDVDIKSSEVPFRDL